MVDANGFTNKSHNLNELCIAFLYSLLQFTYQYRKSTTATK